LAAISGPYPEVLRDAEVVVGAALDHRKAHGSSHRHAVSASAAASAPWLGLCCPSCRGGASRSGLPPYK
jgi:hypothetical protein